MRKEAINRMQKRYVEMACPDSIAKPLVKALERARENMKKGLIAGEWFDRSPILTADNFSFKEMLVINPLNIAYIINDFRAIPKKPEGYRVILEITTLNEEFWETKYNPEDWVFLPRVIGNKKSDVIHFITVDIKKKVDDPQMQADAMLKELGISF